MNDGFLIPDGNEVLRNDIGAILFLIEKTAKWVNPRTFQLLPVWCPYVARGQALYDRTWTRRYTNTTKATGVTSEKTEGNVAALNALVAALDVAKPKPKNWTVCHVWGYDDISFAAQSEVVKDPRFYSCIANMVWLPSALKAFTDTVPEIKAILRVCAFQMYGWACEHPSVSQESVKVMSGWVPDQYPKNWPSPQNSGILPIGTAPFTDRIKKQVERRKKKLRQELHDDNLVHYPRQQVLDVLKFWNVCLND